MTLQNLTITNPLINLQSLPNYLVYKLPQTKSLRFSFVKFTNFPRNPTSSSFISLFSLKFPTSLNPILMVRGFLGNYKRRLIIVGCALFFLLVILEIWALNRLSTSGEQINRFDRASGSLKIENQILGNKIAKLTSLKEIETKALLLGFRPIKRVEYLKTSDIALNH